jgi:hypothetical protein
MADLPAVLSDRLGVELGLSGNALATGVGRSARVRQIRLVSIVANERERERERERDEYNRATHQMKLDQV